MIKTNLFYENVTVLDYAYLCPTRGVVGNSLYVDVIFEGSLDEEGILYDFSYAKKKVKEIVDQLCDHRLAILKKDGKMIGDKIFLQYHFQDGVIDYEAPSQAVWEIDAPSLSYKDLQEDIAAKVLAQLPKNISAVKIFLREEISSGDDCYFNYSHGLKDHYGNCQRLLHGHRNTFKIFLENKRAYDLESFYVNKVFSGSVHFAFWANVVNKEEILTQLKLKSSPLGKLDLISLVELEYRSSQGIFKAKIPGKMIYLLPQETTVELLSSHFYEQVKAQFPSKKVKVIAYEGIGKGAITE